MAKLAGGEGQPQRVPGVEQSQATKTVTQSPFKEWFRGVGRNMGRKAFEAVVFHTPLSMSTEPKSSKTTPPTQAEVEAALSELSGTYLNPTAGNKALDKGMELVRQSGLDYTATAGRGEGGFWDVRFDKHEKPS